jgi:glyoxylase-like metal-dependent hydrolase (beta-lactamase superfamily II)
LRRWPRRLFVALVVLLVAAAAAYYWLIFDSWPSGQVTPTPIDMARARTLADQQPGEKATEVRVETVATMEFPAVAVIGGESWAGFPMGLFSYQLVFPHQTIILDTAMDEEGGRSMGARFAAGAYADMLAAMGRASQILITHEHPDHIGGILKYPDPTHIEARLSLTVEQIANAGRYAGFDKPPPVLEEARPVAYEDYLAVAPGVVLIKAPGHSPGSQMVFVQLANGKEYLFAGDIGWSLRNIEEVRGRARLVSQFMLGEDRRAVFDQLQALHDLRGKEPDLIIVPGHDLGFINTQVEAGNMTAGFVEQ